MTGWGWRITMNPLFVKSVCTRLRLRSRLIWGGVTLTLTTWIFSMVFFGSTKQGVLEQADAARATLVALLYIQGFILMFLGTGAVAHGVAEEKEAGLIDYQRLTPMAASDKVLGYLFGLPVREYMMFALTLPFTVITAVVGRIALINLVQLYAVFFLSVMLYHLTGLVAGMVSTRPRRAGWFSRLAVLCLYLVLPQLANFGFTFFGYLTIFPTFNVVVRDEWGPAAVFEVLARWETAPFFNLEIHPTVFTLAVQGFFVAVFFVVLLRKWRHETDNALTKAHAVLVFAVLQLLVLGSLWPLVSDPSRFPLLQEIPNVEDFRGAAAALFYTFWILSFLTGAILLHVVTPDPDGLRRGLRRAHKLGNARVGWFADRAPSLWCAAVIAALAASAYIPLVKLASREQSAALSLQAQLGFFDQAPDLLSFIMGPVTFAALIFAVQAVRQRYGGRGLLLATFGLGIVPLLFGFLLTALEVGQTLPVVLSLISPASGLMMATFDLFGVGLTGFGLAGMLISVAIAFWAVMVERRHARTVRRAVDAEHV